VTIHIDGYHTTYVTDVLERVRDFSQSLQ